MMRAVFILSTEQPFGDQVALTYASLAGLAAVDLAYGSTHPRRLDWRGGFLVATTLPLFGCGHHHWHPIPLNEYTLPGQPLLDGRQAQQAIDGI